MIEPITSAMTFGIAYIVLFTLIIYYLYRVSRNDMKRALEHDNFILWSIPQIIYPVLVLVVFILYPVSTEYLLFYIGIILFSIGFVTKLFSLLEFKRKINKVLDSSGKSGIIDTGIYSRIRHPMYSGSLLIYFSFSIILSSIFGVALFFLFLLPSYLVRIGLEERNHINNKEYQKYKKSVPSLIPRRLL